MPISQYDISISLFTKTLLTLKHILQKAQNHAPAESASLPSARLHDDMRPLAYQIQAVCNYPKKFLQNTLPKLSPPPSPEWEDWSDAVTMDRLVAYLDETLAYFEGLDPKALEGAEDAVLAIPFGSGGGINIEGKGLALGLVLPNVFFYLSMAYAILRSRGVPLGKKDFSNQYLEPWVLSQFTR
jgi:uncharacterized protein